MLVLALDLYCVSLAAAVLGGLLGARFLLWVLEGVAEHSDFYQTFAASPLLVYGAKGLAALLLGLIAHRYLN